jgi:hypothetical protein
MAIPSAPTATTIVTEALKRKLNGGTPTAAQITRATDYGLEKVKRDIMLICQSWRPLVTTATSVTVAGTATVDNPVDLEQHIEVTLDEGAVTRELIMDNTKRRSYSEDQGIPIRYFPFDDPTTGYISLEPIPDAVYTVGFTYYADLRRVDLSSSLYTTILRRWAGVFEQGVYVWTLQEDDSRYQAEFQIYDSMLKQLKARDGYMMNESDIVRQVVD